MQHVAADLDKSNSSVTVVVLGGCLFGGGGGGAAAAAAFGGDGDAGTRSCRYRLCRFWRVGGIIDGSW